MFPAGDPQALAGADKAALSDPKTYGALPKSTLHAWEGIQVPVTFDGLIQDWIDSVSSNRPPGILRYSLAEKPLPDAR